MTHIHPCQFFCGTALLLALGAGSLLRADVPSATTDVAKAAPPGTLPVLPLKGSIALPAAEPAKEMVLDLGNNISLKLVSIPAGRFLMGSPEGEKYRFPNEGPQHEVTIGRPFYMSIYLVTQEQYAAVMGAIPSPAKPGDEVPAKGATLPVHPFTYEDITGFCQKLSEKIGKKVRILTEAEWEYTSRAGTQTTWFFGDDPKDHADYGWFQAGRHPVGLKKPNPWGLHDVYGNVGQVCSDWGAHYPKDTEASYTKDPVTDPAGPAKGEQYVARGQGPG